jgi:hypothetical protein
MKEDEIMTYYVFMMLSVPDCMAEENAYEYKQESDEYNWEGQDRGD